MEYKLVETVEQLDSIINNAIRMASKKSPLPEDEKVLHREVRDWTRVLKGDCQAKMKIVNGVKTVPPKDVQAVITTFQKNLHAQITDPKIAKKCSQEKIESMVREFIFYTSMLPPVVDETQVVLVIRDVIEDLNATSLRDTGRVIGEVKRRISNDERFAGQKLDMSSVSSYVRSSLA